MACDYHKQNSYRFRCGVHKLGMPLFIMIMLLMQVSVCQGMEDGNTVRISTTQARDAEQENLAEIDELDEWSENQPDSEVYDPIEPVNRIFFHFNDKLYFWALKPLAEGYSWIVPKAVRESIDNFFLNALTPVRAANCLLQMDFRGAESEMARLVINSTVGIAGFMDPARDIWSIERVEEDFGQTLGAYGLSPGPYLVLPFLGPSSPRDGIGTLVDAYLNPANYYLAGFAEQAAIRGTNLVNSTSLNMGEYESLKNSSIDPYIALRSAYRQYRENLVTTHSMPAESEKH